MRALEKSDALLDRKMRNIVGKHLQYVGAYLRRRGAPRRESRFADFLEDLLNITWAMGGRVSFNRKTGKGNVADLLGDLRQFMPPGFIPEVLPLALIERSCTQARAFARDIASNPITAYDDERLNKLPGVSISALNPIRIIAGD
jgi:hypothetical protein